MNLLWILVIILIVLAVAGAPGFVIPHNYGYWPSGTVGLILIILVVLLLMGRL